MNSSDTYNIFEMRAPVTIGKFTYSHWAFSIFLIDLVKLPLSRALVNHKYKQIKLIQLYSKNWWSQPSQQNSGTKPLFAYFSAYLTACRESKLRQYAKNVSRKADSSFVREFCFLLSSIQRNKLAHETNQMCLVVTVGDIIG